MYSLWSHRCQGGKAHELGWQDREVMDWKAIFHPKGGSRCPSPAECHIMPKRAQKKSWKSSSLLLKFTLGLDTWLVLASRMLKGIMHTESWKMAYISLSPLLESYFHEYKPRLTCLWLKTIGRRKCVQTTSLESANSKYERTQPESAETLCTCSSPQTHDKPSWFWPRSAKLLNHPTDPWNIKKCWLLYKTEIL